MTDEAVATSYVALEPEVSGFGRKLSSGLGGEVGGAGKSLGRGFGKAFAAAGAAVAAVGVGKFLTGAVGDAEEARKLNAITANAIKATGGAAKVTKDQVTDLASSIAAKTGIDDAQIQAGQNLILTFKQIQNVGKGSAAIFDRTTKAAVDLSAAGFGSVTGASLQLGKALNDPLKGISALGRSGVTFTQQQKDQIKTLVESGRTLKAQKIILKEVEGQVGGAAEAGATASEKFAYAFGEFKEGIGALLLPVVDRAAKFLLNKALPAMERVQAFIVDSVVPAVRDLAGEVSDRLGPVLDALRPVFDRVGDFLRENPKFVKTFAIALGVLVAAIGAVTLATTLFSIALNSTGIPLVIIGIAALVAGLVVAYQKSETFRSIVDSLAESAKSFGLFLRDEVLPVVVDLAQTIAEKAKPVLAQLGETFRGDILPAIKLVVDKFREALPTIQQVIGFIVRLIAGGIKFGVTVLSKVLPPIIRFVGFVVSKVVPAVIGFIEIVAKIISKAIEFGGTIVDQVKKVAEFVSGLKEKFGNALDYVKGIPEKIKNGLGDLASALYEKGKEFISGLISGIKDKTTDAIAEVRDIPSKLKAAFNGAGGLGVIYHGAGPNVSPSDPVVGGGHEAAERFGEAAKREFVASLPKVGALAGEVLGKGIGEGVEEQFKKDKDKLRSKVRDQLRGLVDELRAQLADVKGAARDLASSVADAFRPDLFSGGLADLFANGGAGVSNLKALQAAFAKLRDKFKLGEGFLSDLFASGNSALIFQLASGDAATAQAAQQLFNRNNQLANSLGQTVGQNEFGDEIDELGNRLEKALEKLEKATKNVGKEVGDRINAAAVRGRRRPALAA